LSVTRRQAAGSVPAADTDPVLYGRDHVRRGGGFPGRDPAVRLRLPDRHGLRILDRENLIISFNLSDIGRGRTELRIRDKNLKVPADLRLYRVTPERVRIRVAPDKKQESDQEGDSG
jgi:hypothetical protein